MTKTESYLREWKSKEECAEAILPLVGKLYRDHSIVCTTFNFSLVHKSPVEIILAHRTARQRAGHDIRMQHTLAVLTVLSEMDLAPARIDVGKLVARFHTGEHGDLLEDFLRRELAEVNTGRGSMRAEPQDVVLYGFGRIGRLLARILIAKVGGGEKFRLRAIVTRRGGADDLKKRADLLRTDSVHGRFQGSVELDEEENALIVNGNLVRLIYSDAPESVDYESHGIRDAIIIDNTGRWRSREGLSKHLEAKGAAKVLLTAPGKGDIPNIVHGINHGRLDPDERVVSAASCTTNAIVPILAAMEETFGIESGHLESIHSFTNDQNLIDNIHPKTRRGRAATLNLVITETGAAEAVAKALPSLEGKLTGNAIRVPTPNVSLAILNLNLKSSPSRDEINDLFLRASMDSPYQKQIGYTDAPDAVSSDLVGDRHAGVLDSTATVAKDGSCVLYVWYDNEFGYSSQVMRLLQHVARVTPPSY